jgi:hypothetical protein
VHRARQFIALKLDQPVNPRPLRGFIGTVGLDALPAGMRHAGRGLSEKQRIRGVLRIDQEYQRFPESLNPIRRRALLWKLKASGGRHAIGLWHARYPASSNTGEDGLGK